MILYRPSRTRLSSALLGIVLLSSACTSQLHRKPQALACPVHEVLAARLKHLGPNDPWSMRMIAQAEYPLPPETAGLIERHALFALGVQHQRGQGQRFIIQAGQDSGSQYLGERIQARFVERILKKVFPKAEFVTASPRVETQNSDIILQVLDPAEFGMDYQESVVSMPLLKIANPNGMALRPLNTLRESFGIPTEARVLSLSLHSAAHPSFERAGPKLKDILKVLSVGGQRPDMILMSAGYDSLQALQGELARSDYSKISWIPLSQMTPQLYASAVKPVWVFNDLRGYLPYLHRISNVSVVVGAINAAEPLNVGTKTLHFLGPTVDPSYDKTTLQNLVAHYTHSGGYAVVQNTSELQMRLGQIGQMNYPRPVPFEGGTQSPFEKLLDHLFERTRDAIEDASPN